jgi:hypothetical protein
MGDREDLELKSWFNNFVNEFRRRYNDLPENTRKFVWAIDDFNAPCQVISIVLADREFTYLWVRRDHDLPDMEFRCFRPINQNEFIDISEEILSDKNLYKPFKDKEAGNWLEQSFGNFLEKQLIWALKTLQNLPLGKVNFPTDRVIGMKTSIPQNGFFWMVYGDITKVDVELIFKEIFEGDSARGKAQKTQIGNVQEAQVNKEEILSGYSTYFYPPAWIGEPPIFDFRSKANGAFIFPLPTSKIEYKNSMLVFNQKGLFFVGINDRQKCIRFMNEIIGTAILLGYNFDVITDLDIGETTVTKDKGDKRNQTYPKSITRYWQAEGEIGPITEDQIASSTQIKVDELLRIAKLAESASYNAETSDYIIFFAHSSNYVRDGKYKESFLFDWFIIERYLLDKWDLHLGINLLKENKRKKLRHWDINNVIEVLYLTENIDQKTYDGILSLKNIRNRLYHKGVEVSKKDAIKCHEISEQIIIHNESSNCA